MNVIYLRSFLNDIKKIKDKNLKSKVKDFIIELEEAETIEALASVRKLKGYSVAYRAKIKGYRVGIYYDSDIVELARLVKRNDIYKVFPKKGIS